MAPAAAQAIDSDRTENGWIDLPAPATTAVVKEPATIAVPETSGLSLKSADHLGVPAAAVPVAAAASVPEAASAAAASFSSVAPPAAVAPQPTFASPAPPPAAPDEIAKTSAPVPNAPSAEVAALPVDAELASEPIEADPSLKLGIGDGVSVTVYGRPELSTTTYVTDKGAIDVPLAGAIPVSGATPAVAAERVAAALKEGKFLINPQVTILITQFRSQQVSVLGEVRLPSRFPVESRTTIFDLLAQAGGVTENGASVVFLSRADKNGHVTRYPIDLTGLADGDQSLPPMILKGGDTVFVPKAKQFYIYGEVQAPNMYRLEPGMTVVQAITRSGGLTVRGSNSRVEITRRNVAGQNVTLYPELNDSVQANDVIRVKERIF